MTQTHRQALPKGYMLHEYQVDRVLGAGGFGLTYLGWDTGLNKPVAIKEYLPNDLAVRESDHSVLPKSDGDKENFQWGLDRFLDEARTLASFKHPNIIGVHRYFEAHNTAYIVMEFAEGETLSALLERRKVLDESTLLAILNPLLDGLAEVHRADFLHRDIKPGNILIRADGSPVLLDFGAARQAVGSRSRSITSVVTPGYAPIEQYSSRGNQGPWTDIYALGAVLYKAVCGEAPVDATERMRDDPLTPASEAGADKYSAAFLKAVDWALAVDENARPQSVAEWRKALSGEAAVPASEKAAQEASARKAEAAEAVARKAKAEAEAAEAALRKAEAERQAAAAKKAAGKAQAEQVAAGEVFQDCPECPQMVVVPAGSFMMGSPASERGRYDDEDPVHRVRIGYAFAVGVYEVTFEEWDACVADGGCGHNPGDEGWGRGNRPVINVSWEDAQSYVQWLSGATGKRYRLLSESEWEYVARAGTTTAYHFGGSISSSQANYGQNEGKTIPVGSYPANQFGLHDVHGNVYEWVQDCWNRGYQGAPNNGSAWESGYCGRRVVRGGSWHREPRVLRSADRDWYTSGFRYSYVGFRVARTLTP